MWIEGGTGLLRGGPQRRPWGRAGHKRVYFDLFRLCGAAGRGLPGCWCRAGAGVLQPEGAGGRGSPAAESNPEDFTGFFPFFSPPSPPLSSSSFCLLLLPPLLLPLPLPFPRRAGGRSRSRAAVRMPQLPGAGGGGGDPELCATDEMIPFKDEGDPQKEKIFAEISHPEEEGDLADIKSSLVNESEIAPGANGHEVRGRGGSAGQRGAAAGARDADGRRTLPGWRERGREPRRGTGETPI